MAAGAGGGARARKSQERPKDAENGAGSPATRSERAGPPPSRPDEAGRKLRRQAWGKEGLFAEPPGLGTDGVGVGVGVGARERGWGV